MQYLQYQLHVSASTLTIIRLTFNLSRDYTICMVYSAGGGVPTVTYGSESWTVRKKERKKIDAFELWTWRRILWVPWTEKRTNLSVLEDVKPKRSLEATILQLKLHYFGHIMRAKRSLERDITLGQVEGHRKQGKTTDAMAWQHQGNNRPTTGRPKRSSTR